MLVTRGWRPKPSVRGLRARSDGDEPVHVHAWPAGGPDDADVDPVCAHHREAAALVDPVYDDPAPVASVTRVVSVGAPKRKGSW